MDLISQAIFNEHTDDILRAAAKSWGVSNDALKRLGSFESFVYEYALDGRDYIMKITHSLHRNRPSIEGELDWVNYLAAGGVSVSRAVPSIHGRLVERYDVGDSYFLIYVFEKAPGQHVPKDGFTPDLVQRWGQVLGRMNALSSRYEPSDPSIKRHHWHEELAIRVDTALPESQPLVREKYHRLMQRLRSLPMPRDAYGLVHNDMHHSNFFVHNGTLNVFDFDDCCYHWFAYDVAIPLFYALRSSAVGDGSPAFARHFMDNFMIGYRREYRLDASWMQLIPDFLKLREIELYAIIYGENAHEVNGWCRDYMNGRRERIENDIPVMDIDFSVYA